MDAYERIAAALLGSIDDAGRWVPCWHREGLRMPVNARTGRTYEGMNVLSCWAAKEKHSFGSWQFATYNQWNELEAQVRRGEKGTPIVFWSRTDDDGDKEGHWYARSYTVFNRDQVANPPPIEIPEPLAEDARVSSIEVFFEPVRAAVEIEERDGDLAFYDRDHDRIILPIFARFKDADGYYSTLLHELTHWTGHPDREARTFGERFGDDAYALEELTAELGAVFLAADLGLEPEARDDHAQYIGHWFRLLKEQPAAFAHAVGQARRAARRIHAIAEGDGHVERPVGNRDPAPVEP